MGGCVGGLGRLGWSVGGPVGRLVVGSRQYVMKGSTR